MNQEAEARELLEVKKLAVICYEQSERNTGPCCKRWLRIIDQAIALLPPKDQQPAEGDFTKGIRAKINIFNKIDGDHIGEELDGEAVMYDLLEACDRLDTSESERNRLEISWANENGLKEVSYQKRVELESTNKDLLEALENLYTVALKIGHTHDQDMRKKFAQVQVKAESAIAKANKQEN